MVNAFHCDQINLLNFEVEVFMCPLINVYLIITNLIILNI